MPGNRLVLVGHRPSGWLVETVGRSGVRLGLGNGCVVSVGMRGEASVERAPKWAQRGPPDWCKGWGVPQEHRGPGPGDQGRV